MNDRNKEELKKQNEEVVKMTVEMLYPKSPEDRLLEQVVAGRESNSARDKDRKRFFKK